jgi:hypothetical protein
MIQPAAERIRMAVRFDDPKDIVTVQGLWFESRQPLVVGRQLPQRLLRRSTA